MLNKSATVGAKVLMETKEPQQEIFKTLEHLHMTIEELNSKIVLLCETLQSVMNHARKEEPYPPQEQPCDVKSSSEIRTQIENAISNITHIINRVDHATYSLEI